MKYVFAGTTASFLHFVNRLCILLFSVTLICEPLIDDQVGKVETDLNGVINAVRKLCWLQKCI
jgi:hypothetical protein